MKRYEPYHAGMVETPDGRYVLHCDTEAEKKDVIDFIVGFIPFGWRMPLGFWDVVGQARRGEATIEAREQEAMKDEKDGMIESDDGRYLDRDEVVNGRSIGEWIDMAEKGIAVLCASDSPDTLGPIIVLLLRSHGWSHVSDPIKGWRVKEKCVQRDRCGKSDCPALNGVCDLRTGIASRPLTQAEALTLFPRAYRTIARLIPWVLKETFTIGHGEIVEEGE